MAGRVTEKDLTEAAAGLSALTGLDFRVVSSVSGWGLYTVRPGTTTRDEVKLGLGARELYDWMYAYHAGVEHGLRLAAERASDEKPRKWRE